MTGSLTVLGNIIDLNNANSQVDCQAVKALCVAGTTTDVDLLLANDCWLYSATFAAAGLEFGDSLSLSNVDKDGVYSPAGTIAATYVNAFYLQTGQGSNLMFQNLVPPKILGGTYLRAIYKSTSALVGVTLAANYTCFDALV